MSTLNISLPDQLKIWISQQVGIGRYSSASDYLRDLIREDIRHQDQEAKWLANHLKPLIDTPNEKFIMVTAEQAKAKARRKLQD